MFYWKIAFDYGDGDAERIDMGDMDTDEI